MELSVGATLAPSKGRRSMTPVIRVSEVTWEKIKTWAIPLEDTADDALLKALDAAEKYRTEVNRSGTLQTEVNALAVSPQALEGSQGSDKKPVKRLPNGQRIPTGNYHLPILRSLYELGVRAAVRDVLLKVEYRMKHLFSDIEYQLISGGVPRWYNTANWARLELVEGGLIKPVEESGRGTWELTEQGIKEMERETG